MILQHTSNVLLRHLDNFLSVRVQILKTDITPRSVVWTVRGDRDDIDRLSAAESIISYAFTGRGYVRPPLLVLVDRIDDKHARIGVTSPI